MKKILIFLIGVLSGILILQMYNHSKFLKKESEPSVPYQSFFEESDFHKPKMSDIVLSQSYNVEAYNSTKVPILSQNSDSTIYIRYSAHGCAQCVNTLFSQLSEIFGNRNDKKIVFLIKNISNRDMYVNWQAHDKKYMMFKCDSIPTDTVVDEDALYIFRLTPQGKIKDHFVLQYGDTTFIKNFLINL